MLYVYQLTFSENKACDNVKKYCRAGQTTNDNKVCRHFTWDTKNTHSEYKISIAFSLQHWLHERGSMLRYMLIASVAIFASIMNEIPAQHLHAFSLCGCSKVHICTFL